MYKALDDLERAGVGGRDARCTIVGERASRPVSAVGELAGVLAGLLLAALAAAAGYAGAVTLADWRSARLRLCAAALGSWWLGIVSFLALTSLGAFRLLPALLAWVALLAGGLRLAGPSRVARALRDDLSALRWLRPTRGSAGLVVLAGIVAFAAGLRLLRGVISPPIAWDALTYHLYNAARWVGQGTMPLQPGPDGWGYYEHFPFLGDVLWAWAMLGPSSDALLALSGVLPWGVAGAAAYALGRELGAERHSALLSALTLLATPAVVSYLTTSYVNNSVLALFLLGAVFAARFETAPDTPSFVLAAVALSIAGGVASYGLAILATAGLFLLTRLALARQLPRLRTLGLAALFALPGAAGYLRAWIATGSPLYPSPLRVAGHTLLAGNETFELICSGAGLAAGTPEVATSTVLHRLFFGRHVSGEYMSFWPGALLLVLLGALGAARLLFARGRHPLLVGLLLGVAMALLLGVFSPDLRGVRAIWVNLGRYLTPGLAGLLALGASVRFRGADLVRAALLLTAMPYALPRELRGWELAAMARFAGTLAALAALAWLLWRVVARRLRLHWSAATALVAFLVPALAVLVSARARQRHVAYAAAASREAPPADPHPLFPPFVAPHVWHALDQPRGLRLAVTAGWDGVGHNWYRYPLFGSRLQNTLLYAPITRTGEVLDYRLRERVAAEADVIAWLERLLALRVDAVVALAPPAPELGWLQRGAPVFEPLAADGAIQAFRFQSDAARVVVARLRGAGAPAAPGPAR